jgi:predicted Na+-dependent transporter
MMMLAVVVDELCVDDLTVVLYRRRLMTCLVPATPHSNELTPRVRGQHACSILSTSEKQCSLTLLHWTMMSDIDDVSDSM